ncbi:GntR family transcriptional regulator [Bordetella pertussis]|nr:GntR family transcriptional regulator [Bordetella pertussis]CFO36360.1 GntR family transcriptional regulator [Bordetella pertussis]CPJ84336.1 GntR family transcriptional regulator [Bordetella pertussis]CPK56529.1 GntR family transcriptional regulator [Bordetella pertussis]CPP60771.1 GntR family transcriptional regulator [Bordetella pertussis]
MASLSPEHARDIVEVRATLEALNARLAAQPRNPQQVVDMDRAIRDGAHACEHGDTAALVEQNRQFHELLGGVSTNAVLQDLMRSLRDRTALLFARNSVTRAADILDEHAGILQAVTAGDADLASLLAARHVHNAAQWYFERPVDRKAVAADTD